MLIFNWLRGLGFVQARPGDSAVVLHCFTKDLKRSPILIKTSFRTPGWNKWEIRLSGCCALWDVAGAR